MTWLATFAAMFVTDLAWALYVASVKSGSAFAAAGWSVLLFILGAVAVIGYTRDRWLLIPASLGAFAGTFAGVQWPLTNG